MPLTASFTPYDLHFKQPAGTSRGVLRTKKTYFFKISGSQGWGIGECALFRGLSYDDVPDYTAKLQWLCDHINDEPDSLFKSLKPYPSIVFGLEQALLSLKSTDPFVLFPSDFTTGKAGIGINGLIWMGDKEFMRKQIIEKLHKGYRVIKLKIGALDFDSELELLRFIRKDFPVSEVEIRVDANGAFKPDTALEKLKRLSDFDLHSIEQPIKAGQWHEMAELCSRTPLPIALDEELIGIIEKHEKRNMLETIKPQFIILKPALAGGFSGSTEWIRTAADLGIKWWITSALESNIGLNAIAQFTFTLGNPMVQGLGTGSLFTNNIKAPLQIQQAALFYNPDQNWNLSLLKFNGI